MRVFISTHGSFIRSENNYGAATACQGLGTGDSAVEKIKPLTSAKRLTNLVMHEEGNDKITD